MRTAGTSTSRGPAPAAVAPPTAARHDERDSIMVFDMATDSCIVTIPNIWRAQAVGEYVCSEVFAAGGYDWAICFYPGGMNPEDSDYSSAFVALMTEASDARACFMLKLEDQGAQENHHPYGKLCGPYTLMKGYMWGFHRFLKRDHLRASRCIKDDCLILHCTVGFVKAPLRRRRHYRVVVPPSDIGQGLKALLDSSLGTDIDFVVGDQIFKAHKVILAARSSVFRAQFFGPISGGDIKKLVVEGVDPSIFKAMLEYIYTDQFPDIGKIAGSTSHPASTNVVMHLTAAADYYCLDRLRLLCESKLSKHITVDTVVNIIALADRYQLHKLKGACLEFATNPANLRALIESEGLMHLERTCPSVLMHLVLAGRRMQCSSGRLRIFHE
ncbi:BTB/POZ and MATH domain-containing protein 3-like [Rhodamnia argentea]|uniref:BTB/POZ and MATH domain-containing protein 3-like n=1 Tax=Rhodamnia argentea TaxID=178133 RepID=A0A8B8PIL8_9MYRT|nr:BTB/POZ and MATH domain-containing protein 3-like [Rhodamnia argentea]